MKDYYTPVASLPPLPRQFDDGPIPITAASLRRRVSMLDIELAADTLHQVLLGEQSLKKAFAGGLLKVRGPVWKTSDLGGLLDQGRQIYPQVLEEQGLALQQAGVQGR